MWANNHVLGITQYSTLQMNTYRDAQNTKKFLKFPVCYKNTLGISNHLIRIGIHY